MKGNLRTVYGKQIQWKQPSQGLMVSKVVSFGAYDLSGFCRGKDRVGFP